MANAGSLTVALGLESAKFRSGLDSADKRMRGFSKSSQRSIQTMSKGFLRMQGIVAGVFSVAVIRKSLNEIDNLAKSAKAVGVEFEKFQRISLGLEKLGLDAGSAEKGFAKMSRAVEQLRQKSITAVSAFDELGISLNVLERLSPSKQFELITNRLGGMTNVTDRLNVAQAILGRGFVRLKDGFDEILKGGEDLKVVSLADAEAIEAFNDKLNELGKNIRGTVAPLLAKLNDGFDLLRVTLNRIPEASNIAIFIGSLTAGFIALSLALKGFALALSFALSPLGLIAVSLSLAVAGLVSFRNELDKLPFVGSSITFLGKRFDALKNKILGVNRALLFDGGNAGGLGSALSRLEGDSKQRVSIRKAEIVTLSRLDQEHLDARQALDRLAVNDRDRLFAFRESKQGKLLKNNLKNYATGEKTKTQIAFQGTKEIVGNLSGANKKMFEINKRFQQAQALINTYTGVTTALAAYPPPINFIMAGATLSFGLANIAKIESQQYQGLATGGGVTRGGAFVVGEKGAEVVNLPRGSAVTSNSEVGRIAGRMHEPSQVINFSPQITVMSNDESTPEVLGDAVSEAFMRLVNNGVGDLGGIGLVSGDRMR